MIVAELIDVKNETANKVNSVKVRLSNREKELLFRAAKHEGLSLSAFIRSYCLEVANSMASDGVFEEANSEAANSMTNNGLVEKAKR